MNNVAANLSANPLPNNPLSVYGITDSRVRFVLAPALNDPSDPNQDGICYHNVGTQYFLAPNMNATLNAQYPNGTNIYNSWSQFHAQRYDFLGDQTGSVVNCYLVPFHPVYNDAVVSGAQVNGNNLGIPHWGWANNFSGSPNLTIVGAFERFLNLDNNPAQTPFPGTYFSGWFYGMARDSYRNLLFHELGHTLGLTHPATSNDDAMNGYFDCDDTPKGSISDGNNVMNYNADMNALTPCQLGIIHYNLTHQPNLFYERLNKDFCTSSVAHTITINSGEQVVWNSSKFLKGDIVILPNASLTIKCYVGMPENSKIIVHKGATLIVDGGTITGNCDKAWSGIEVYGTPTAQHQVASPLNGYCEIKNGSLIKSANNAVFTGQIGTNANNGGLA